MVIGTGIDIVEISRVKAAVERWGTRFLHRVFTEEEMSYCQSRKDPFPHFAARFAAKEAVIKALGEARSFFVRADPRDVVAGALNAIGEGRHSVFPAHLRTIEIEREPSGRPRIRLLHSSAVTEFFDRAIVTHISLSHERKYAIAMAVLEMAQENQINFKVL